MSTYTTSIHNLMEMKFPFALNDYPIFNETYRKTLNERILSHYEFREIGFETAGLFNNRLRSRMFEIMPKYNRIYEQELTKYGAFENKSITRNRNQNTNVNATSGGKGQDINSDAPQGALSSEEILGTINYATAASFTKSEAESQSNGATAENEQWNGLENMTKAKAMAEFRDNVINTDMLVIAELTDLFMTIY